MIDCGLGIALDVIHKQDIETLRNWRNHPKVMRWCRQNNLIYPEDQRRWYEWQKKDLNTRMFSIMFGDKLIGVCGLTSIDLINSRAEFSLYIAPKYQGQKFSKPTLKTLFSYGFNELGLSSIWGETFDDNPAKDVFKSLGMKVDGIRRKFYFKDGRRSDAIIFSMLNDEFFELEGEWLRSIRD